MPECRGEGSVAAGTCLPPVNVDAGRGDQSETSGPVISCLGAEGSST